MQLFQTGQIGDSVELVSLKLGRNRLLDHERLMPHGEHRRHECGCGVDDDDLFVRHLLSTRNRDPGSAAHRFALRRARDTRARYFAVAFWRLK